jgi:DNA-nicking Smr family endonuclease
MPSIAHPTIVILWDHELRAATTALQTWEKNKSRLKAITRDSTEAEAHEASEAFALACGDALVACWCALHGFAEQGQQSVTVMSVKQFVHDAPAEPEAHEAKESMGT